MGNRLVCSASWEYLHNKILQQDCDEHVQIQLFDLGIAL